MDINIGSRYLKAHGGIRLSDYHWRGRGDQPRGRRQNTAPCAQCLETSCLYEPINICISYAHIFI